MGAQKRSFLKLLSVLLAATILLAMRGTAQADCVKCDGGDCTADVTSSACQCVIRIIGGATVCREQGWTCGSGSDCSSGPPAQAPTAQAPIEEASLSKLAESERLLALVLMGTVVHDPERHAQLSVESYPGGTILDADQLYRHHGLLSLRADGQVAFHFVLTSTKDGSTVTYFGTLRDRGNEISYVKVSQVSPDGPAERVQRVWKRSK